MTIHYAFHDAAGKIVKCGTTPEVLSLVAKRQAWKNYGLVVDDDAPRAINPNTDRVENGRIVYGEAPSPAASEDDVKRFTRVVIGRRYTEDDQRNVLMSGDPVAIAEMHEFVTSIRAKGRAIRALSPIPLDFRDPKYWT